MTLSETQKVFITFGLAINILRRSRGKVTLVRRRETSDDEAESLNPERNYEDEINEVSRSLSESGVQLMFPRALEILLDFTFFDIDEGLKRSNGSTLSVLIAGLNKLSREQDNARIVAFSGHLSKRIFQRIVGKSDAMYDRGECIAGILSCRGGRSSSQASCHSSLLSHDDSVSDPHPPAYARWVLDAINNVILKIGGIGLNIMKNPYSNDEVLQDYKIYMRLITLSGILRDGILLLVRKCRLLSTRYQGRETKNSISEKFNYLSPRALSTENKGKKDNVSFLRDSGREEEMKRIKRKRDDNYDVKNGTQRMRTNNGFSESHLHENQNHENKYSKKDVRISKRTYHHSDDDEGEDDDENEYLNQSKQKQTHIGRNNSQNIIIKTVTSKNKNCEGSDDDDNDDDDFNNDRGRINNNHQRVQMKTVKGRDSNKQYDNLNQKGNASVNSEGDEERMHREQSSRSSSGGRREDRDEGVQGQGQGQGEREREEVEEDEEGEEDSVESVMVWAMALVARAYDKIEGLPQVKSVYQQIIEGLETENSIGNGF